MQIFQLENKDFFYEHLLDSDENQKLIEKFYVEKEEGKGLENYLKNSAKNEETENSSRTYLIKDKDTKELVGFFSLRNGLFTINIDDDSFFSVPAIELSNFAVNSAYRKNHPESKSIGKSIFSDFVMPLVHYLMDFSGVQALYIYALPEDDLISHYETFGFSRLDSEDEKFVHKHVKPAYDDGCIFMYQIL